MATRRLSASTPRADALAVVCGALALAAASMLAGWAVAFDAEAWLIWGGELARGELDTSAGPSWKPLPVLVTLPLSQTGVAAPLLWVIVARAGGLLALAGAYALATRLRGRAAGAAAAALVALSPWWLLNTWLGNSEGLLAACVFWAVIAQLDGRPRAALGLGLAAALLRPEIWPFAAAAAVWRWRAAPGDRALLAGGAAVWAALWLGPDALGTGGALGASDAALGRPTEGSASLAAVPFAAVLWDAVELLTVPATLGAAAAVILGGARERAIGAAAGAYVLLVAVATQAGYAGNPRYLVPAAALGAALAGVGAARVAPKRAALACALLVAAVAAVQAAQLADTVDALSLRAAQRTALDRLVARAGGAGELRRCGAVRTSIEKRTLIARRLDVELPAIDGPPVVPGSVLRALEVDRPLVLPEAPGAPFALVGREGDWELWQAC